MRLIDARRFVETGTIFFKEVYDNDAVPYAVVSHRWQDDEISFRDVQIFASMPDVQQRHAYWKIRDACRQALMDSLNYIWIDTCCIDKTSSAELQEAINSMYGWYEAATVCYVYLHDLHAHSLRLVDDKISTAGKDLHALGQCEWFGRGWTLQELLAPRLLYFHCADWRRLASLGEVVQTVSKITKIDCSILQHEVRLSEVCVAAKMSWAAQRKTTRVEDRAYSLLGIFDVNLPLLYGEKEKAFIRLQEEIIKTSTDQSIFAWQLPAFKPDGRSLMDPLLAHSPDDFVLCSGMSLSKYEGFSHAFEMTNAGLRLTTFMVHRKDYSVALLDCHYGGDEEHLCGLRLYEIRTAATRGPMFNVVGIPTRLMKMPRSSFDEVELATITINRGSCFKVARLKKTSFVDNQTDKILIYVRWKDDFSLRVTQSWPPRTWEKAGRHTWCMQLNKSFVGSRDQKSQSIDMVYGVDYLYGSLKLKHRYGEDVYLVVQVVKHVINELRFEAAFASNINWIRDDKAPDFQGLTESGLEKQKYFELGEESIEILNGRWEGHNHLFTIV